MATTRGRLAQRIPIAIRLLVSAVVLVAVACGGTSPTSTASKTSAPNLRAPAGTVAVDPCSLVDEKAASAAVGVPVSKSSPTMGAASQGGGICYYTSQDPPAEVVIYAIVFPNRESASSGSADQLASAINPAMGLTNGKVLTGIGDRAIEYDTSGSDHSMAIFVVKSNVVLMIWMAPSKDPAAIEALAKLAVSKL